MPQSPAVMFSAGDKINYTPGSAVTAGDVVVIGNTAMVAEKDISASALGSLALGGMWKVPKKTGAVVAGNDIYWDPAGDPVTGTAGTGACHTAAGVGFKWMGKAFIASASSDDYAYVDLNKGAYVKPPAKFTTDATGSQTADAGDLTGADFVVWKNTANNAVALTTRTATQMFADVPHAQIGQSFVLRIFSGGDNTVTLTAGTGVTITGTATVATTKWRDFLATFTSATAITFQDLGSGNA